MSEASSKFDEREYWLERHRQFNGDVRSVGNLELSLEENLQAAGVVGERLRRVIQILFPGPIDHRVLDLGCGIGLLTPTLVDLGFDYTGVELSPVAVEVARERCANAHFEVGNMTTYKATHRFDLVIASYVLVHLVERQDWIATLENIAHALRDDGMFLLINHLPEHERLRTAQHVVTWTAHEYEEALPSVGLTFSQEANDRLRQRLGAEEVRHYFVIKRLDTPTP